VSVDVCSYSFADGLTLKRPLAFVHSLLNGFAFHFRDALVYGGHYLFRVIHESYHTRHHMCPCTQSEIRAM
jgi:hypothetical protein